MQRFEAIAFSTTNANPLFANAKLFGKEFNQLFICLAIDRRCLDANFQTLAMQAGKFIGTGFGLQMTEQYQSVVLPAKIGFRHLPCPKV